MTSPDLADATTADTRRFARSGDTSYRLLLVAPSLLAICFGVLAPITVILLYSFLTPATYGGVEWTFTKDSYIQLLFEQDIFTEELSFTYAYLGIFLRSLLFALISVTGALILGFPAGYFLATRPPRTRNIWLFLITVPYWVNLLIRTLSLLFVIRDEGPINAVLMGGGLIQEPLKLAYTDAAICLGLIYSYLPFMILPIYAAIERFDIRLIEAAHDLYASKLATLWHVIIPGARPGIIAGSLLVFIPSIGSFLAPEILGGGRNLLIGNLIVQQFEASRNWPLGSAIAVVLMSVVLVGLTSLAVVSGKNKG